MSIFKYITERCYIFKYVDEAGNKQKPLRVWADKGDNAYSIARKQFQTKERLKYFGRRKFDIVYRVLFACLLLIVLIAGLYLVGNSALWILDQPDNWVRAIPLMISFVLMMALLIIGEKLDEHAELRESGGKNKGLPFYDWAKLSTIPFGVSFIYAMPFVVDCIKWVMAFFNIHFN